MQKVVYETYRDYLNEINNQIVANDGGTFKCPLFALYHYGDMCEIHMYNGDVYYGNDVAECIENIIKVCAGDAHRIANIIITSGLWEVQ